MRDLLTRFKFHPQANGLTSPHTLSTSAINDAASKGVNEWFYLLNAPPQSLLELGETKQFGSTLEASNWVASHLQGKCFGQSMALSFKLPFTDAYHSKNQLRYVPADPASVQKYIDFMVKEIQLTATNLAVDSNVPYLHWFGDIIKLLTPAELTQLIFHINRSFKLLKCKESRLVFELDEAPEPAEKIALLAGLGFNTACINDPMIYTGSAQPDDLLAWIDLIRSFGIETVYVRLKISDREHNILPLINALVRKKPAGLLLSAADNLSAPARESTLKQARIFLNEANYQSVRNNFFITNNIARHPVTHCLKGIGLGAVSYTKKYQICNTGKLDDYYTRLNADQIPIQSITELHSEIF